MSLSGETEHTMESPTARSSTIIDEKLQLDVKFQAATTKEVDVEEQSAPIDFPEGGWRAWSTIAGAYVVHIICYPCIARSHRGTSITQLPCSVHMFWVCTLSIATAQPTRRWFSGLF